MSDEQPAFRIRFATEDDVPQIKELVDAVLREYDLQPDPAWADADLEEVQAVYGQRGSLLEVALDRQGAIVGVVGLFFLDHYRAELRKLYVARRSRRRGLGKTLLERAMTHARANGAMELWLETHSRCKEVACLLQDHGFMPAQAARMSARANRVFAIRLHLARIQVGPLVAVPRRFGIGAILLLMVFFGLVFGVMQACRLPPVWFASIFLYFVLVGVGQPLLFRGKKPMLSSFLVGTGAFFVCGFLPIAYYASLEDGPFGWEGLFCGAIGLACAAVMFGGVLGIATGYLLAGVFFLADKWGGKGLKNQIASDAADQDVDPFADDYGPLGEKEAPSGDRHKPIGDQGNPFARKDSPFAKRRNPFVKEDGPFADEGNPFAKGDEAFAKEEDPTGEEEAPTGEEGEPAGDEGGPTGEEGG